MKSVLLSGAALMVLMSYQVQAQQLTVKSIDFGTSVTNRELAGTDTSFASTVGTIYCFTHVEGADSLPTKISHIWFYKDQEKARITLSVESNDWRTWSSKKIQANWKGHWRVMVEDSSGNLLSTKSFVIR